MDDFTRQKFDEIIAKDPTALTIGDIEFLRARSSYLSKVQLDFYKDYLKIQRPEETQVDLRRSRSYRDLQRQAAELGYAVVGVKREDLERMIDTAVGPTDAK